MKKVILTIFLFAGLVSYSNAQTRSLDNFSSLSVCGSIKVTLVKGSSNSAEIEMVKGDIDDLKLNVEGDQLNIEFKNKKIGNWGNNNRKANITLTYKSLDELDACAGGSIKSNETLKASDFDVEASSGASISVTIESESLDVEVSSGASVNLEGETGDLDIEISSGATFNGMDLKASTVDAEASSGATAKVWATRSLDAEASSGASIKYKGDPSDIDLDPGKWSGGSIRKM